MKGKLIKDGSKWIVAYNVKIGNVNVYQDLPLHPDDVSLLRVYFEGQKVDFKIEHYCKHMYDEGCDYAKLKI
jgi:hypothetical protein